MGRCNWYVWCESWGVVEALLLMGARALCAELQAAGR